MAIDYLDLTGSGGASSPHSGIHLVSIEFPALFVEGFTCRDLLPGLDARNAFHVTEDNDTHTIPLCPIFYNLACFGRVLGFLVLSFKTGGSYSR